LPVLLCGVGAGVVPGRWRRFPRPESAFLCCHFSWKSARRSSLFPRCLIFFPVANETSASSFFLIIRRHVFEKIVLRRHRGLASAGPFLVALAWATIAPRFCRARSAAQRLLAVTAWGAASCSRPSGGGGWEQNAGEEGSRWSLSACWWFLSLWRGSVSFLLSALLARTGVAIRPSLLSAVQARRCKTETFTLNAKA
jgi:hypothetical protein